MSRRSIRKRVNRRKRLGRLRAYAIWGGIASALLIVLGFFAWNALQPAAGELVPVMPNTRHIPKGPDAGPYETFPPTSGPHYATTLRPGFYPRDAPTGLEGDPEGYLVHNLEHGFVVLWYNCQLLDENGCTSMAEGIQEIMVEANNVKVIAFPEDGLSSPLVMTSWGRIQALDSFQREAVERFVLRNRNRAPEAIGH